MSTAPRGMSIQEGYRLYRSLTLFVNRRYQRKLVWAEPEKARLIESILKGFPIPLILLAEQKQIDAIPQYEIIDGLQRLNAIFSFIENAYSVGGRYFDLNQFARAKQLADAGAFAAAPEDAEKLSPGESANFLDYQLAVTIYAPSNANEVTDVFGRINSGGKQLSDQEKRQAGSMTLYGNAVRRISAELRGDASKEVLPLTEMPEISIDSRRARQMYGLTAEDVFWCKHGVLQNQQLRDSEDEEIIADIVASILLGQPIARSRELLDDLYTPESEIAQKAENALVAYPASRLDQEVKATFSIVKEVVESVGVTLRSVVNPGSSNPIKAAYYAIFMAFFDLVTKKQLVPADSAAIVKAITNLQKAMITTAHYSKPEDRVTNIDKTIGLIQRHFVHSDPPAIGHGPGLILDFENSLRRSSIETSKYEFKQGLLRLSVDRAFDEALMTRLSETICALANAGPDADGFLYLGVADTESDAARVAELDGITASRIGQRYVVGIGREAKVLKISLEQYVDRFIGGLKKSPLSEPLRSHVLSMLDVIDYRGMNVIRVFVPRQAEISFVGDFAFGRVNSQTTKLEGKALLGLNELFKRERPRRNS